MIRTPPVQVAPQETTSRAAAATHGPLPLAGRIDGSGTRPISPRAVFEAAGFDARRSRSWLAAISFFEREGHLKVPRGHRELDRDLYSAVDKVRVKYRGMRLTNAQVIAWESIGMIWEIRTVVTKEQRADIVRLYDDDRKSIRAVATQVGCAYSSAHRVLKDAGKLRSRGKAKAHFDPHSSGSHR